MAESHFPDGHKELDIIADSALISHRDIDEIDFVCNKGSKRYYIQSPFAVPDEKKQNQEKRPLIHTGDGFKGF